MRKLTPFIQDEIIRVGGRLNQADLSYDQMHPILLSKNSLVVNLIIEHYHKINLHTGPQLLFSLLRQKYWTLSARSLIRKQLRACNVCYRANPRPVFPQMGDLPAPRVTPSNAFQHAGINYAGPFAVCPKIGRGIRPQKAYLCLFICLTTRAIHLELAPDLSTDSFLNAFKRFTSRRGPCRVLYSDCGTNFIGAKAKLDEQHRLLLSKEHQDKFGETLADMHIIWKFNPPSSPHFGGLWEGNIKSVKTHVNRVVGQQILSYEEFETILIQIEALLNSRPLCELSTDPAEPSALTPAHFLTAVPLKVLPAMNVDKSADKHLTRPELLNALVQRFWERWSVEYLHTLQVRQKWCSKTKPLRPGTVVIMMDSRTQPLQWPLGLVEEVYPGADGAVGVVLVRTTKGRYKRPAVKLCPLPSQ